MRGVRGVLVVVYAVAFAVRFAYASLVVSPFEHVVSDMGTYWRHAHVIAFGEPIADPRLLALYPWGAQTLIAGELRLFGESHTGIAAVHALVGALTAPAAAYLAWRLAPARRRRRATRIALGAGLLVALWEPLVAYSGYFLSEVWFPGTMLAAVALYTASEARAPGSRGAGAGGGTWRALGAGVFAAIAFTVRPQMIVTWLLLVPLARRRRVLLALPMLLIVAFSAVRLHALSGHWGLISENGAMQRVFGDTHVQELFAHWKTSKGEDLYVSFAPVRRGGAKPEHSLKFEGYICDPEIMEQLRARELAKDDLATRARRTFDNVVGLYEVFRPWPDLAFAPSIAWKRIADVCMNLGYVALALGAYALVARRPSRVRRGRAAWRAIVACYAALLVVAAFYRGEPRFRVPYDPLMLSLAAVGAACGPLSFLRRKTYRLP